MNFLKLDPDRIYKVRLIPPVVRFVTSQAPGECSFCHAGYPSQRMREMIVRDHADGKDKLVRGPVHSMTKMVIVGLEQKLKQCEFELDLYRRNRHNLLDAERMIADKVTEIELIRRQLVSERKITDQYKET